jgi:hypothetical protein
MTQVTNFLNKWGMLVLIFIALMIWMKACGIASTQSATKKEIKALDSTLRKEIKIEGLKTSKRTLYDWNSVIRTVNRPDDLINEYDKQINQLSK